ncbi:mycofactocin dehydrogenase MftG [Nocardia caishijiensis]|uniref:Dehydrogenase (TIGR03970 family) n=1 Tax=Nocardia caishijiensis TaxID=184756 RepID=A0ABQ6YTN5_9NOCA|nr:mycofactocin system GMC family oxidoreductase MftG [Nocardia caishijiensis]KAF0848831.1 putative dehydrogenase (TIGR03970 family) [Nocardia caishijiensis]
MPSTLVVGAGSAGCVLAARLSDDPAHTVLVLEAGTVWPGPADIPADLLDPGHLPVGPESAVLWRYAGNLVRGKLIGGSGAINGSYFVRPPAARFGDWNSDRWTFDALLPFFRDLETDLDHGTDPGHGTEGPIPVVRAADPTPFSADFAERCAAAGLREVADLNALDVTDGFGRVPLALSGNRRAGPGITHLYPVLDRPNLTVVGETTVTRLVMRGTRAVGVEWVRGHEYGRTDADRIVLCAGAVESAALLLRSGIGPERQLRALGIPVVRPAPVGTWCTDHPEIGIEFAGTDHGTSAVALEYVLEHGDLEFRPYTPMFTPGLRRVGVTLMRPTGSAELTLRRADPAVPAHIDQSGLVTSADRANLRSGVELACELFDLRFGPVDDHWLRANSGASQHLSGTCRMGPANDEQSVVDDLGRVHGIDGLSIVDLSVVPVPLPRGPQATVVTLAAAIAACYAV